MDVSPHSQALQAAKSDGKRPSKVLKRKQPYGRTSKRRCVRQVARFVRRHRSLLPAETWLEVMHALNAFDLDVVQCISKLFRTIIDGHRVSLAWRRLESATLRFDADFSQCWFVEVTKFHAYSALQGASRDGHVWQRRNVDVVSASLDVAAEAFVAALKFSVVYSRFCFGFGHMLVQDVFYFIGKCQRTCRILGTASAPPTTMFKWCSAGFNTNRALVAVPENKLSPTIFVELLLDAFETAPSFAVELLPRFFYYRYLNDVDLCAWATKGLRKFRLLANQRIAIGDEGIIGFCFNECVKAGEDVELELHYPNVGENFFDKLVQVAVDAFQGFNQYEQMGDEYFDFLQNFNDCKPPHCSPIKSGILLIPVVVESRHHFVMALVDIRNQEIYLADSLNGGRKSSANAELLVKIREYVIKLLGAHGYPTGYPQEWAVAEQVNVPQQSNGVDCGVFDLLYADYFSRGLSTPFDFSQEHIPYFRRKMFKELRESSASHYSSNFGLIQCN